MKNTCTLMMLLIFASPAYGMVYRWTDFAGVAHYTNKEYEIPSRFRAKAKALYPEQGDTAVPQQNVPAPKPDVPPAPVQQAKPGDSANEKQPAITPGLKNTFPERATRSGRRRREVTEE
jgi:hypothetical protein